MVMRTHELHPAVIHMPLTLLPAASIVDLAAAMRPRDRTLDRMGRTLWWSMVGAGLFAGLAGMAASQEIEVGSPHARDVMFLHGIGNVTLVAGALGVAMLRSRRPASFTTAIGGFAATAAEIYTAYLGGELVYSHGAGVKALGGAAAETPALFSAHGMKRLAVDAVRGLRWLFTRGERAIKGEERIERGALGPIVEEGTVASRPTIQ